MNQDDITSVRKYLAVIKQAVALIEARLDGEAPAVQALEAPKTTLVQKQEMSEEEAHKIARQKHVNDLMAIDVWPEAVPAFLASSEITVNDQINRGRAALRMFLDRSIEGLRVLDFGCGEGWIAHQAREMGAEVTGYDIKRHETWDDDRMKGIHFTNDFSKLPPAYYDVVFLYDVVDHAVDPKALMGEVKHALAKDGYVYVRCHPWTAKHAGHVFRSGLNRAYIQLFLTDEEIKSIIGEDAPFVYKTKSPLDLYAELFDQFQVLKRHAKEEDVHPFFYVESFKELLATEQQLSEEEIEIDDLLKSMRMTFIDYCLRHK